MHRPLRTASAVLLMSVSESCGGWKSRARLAFGAEPSATMDKAICSCERNGERDKTSPFLHRRLCKQAYIRHYWLSVVPCVVNDIQVQRDNIVIHFHTRGSLFDCRFSLSCPEKECPLPLRAKVVPVEVRAFVSHLKSIAP